MRGIHLPKINLSDSGGYQVCEKTRLRLLKLFLFFASFLFIAAFVFASIALSEGQLPGSDMSDKLEAAGTLLRIVDTALFTWAARVFAGICLMSAAWALKEQRIGVAVICIVGAFIFGSAPKWIKDIFTIGGADSIFGMVPLMPSMFAAQLSSWRGRKNA